MNLNYKGSVAERFMKFRSTVNVEENIKENLFNAISVYLPESEAKAQLDQYAGLNGKEFEVKTVTVDNYNSVFQGNMLSDLKPLWNDGTNSALTLYVIVFPDSKLDGGQTKQFYEFAVTQNGLKWEPLEKAFERFYNVSFFKMVYCDDTACELANETDDDQKKKAKYFFFSALLSKLCDTESTLSWCLIEATKDLNKDEGWNCFQEGSTELSTAGNFAGLNWKTFCENFWGVLKNNGCSHTWLFMHSKENACKMLPVVLGKWFEQPNGSGEYIGNKLSKIRLAGDKVHPTGLVSAVNSDVYENLTQEQYKILDKKQVGYFISISGSSLNNCELTSDKSLVGFPTNAYMISKFIDYTASQELANYVVQNSTLTKPVLANEDSYVRVQNILANVIASFVGTRRIENVRLSFPPYAQAKQGNKFVGNAVWHATYIDDLEAVEITGSITM